MKGSWPVRTELPIKSLNVRFFGCEALVFPEGFRATSLEVKGRPRPVRCGEEEALLDVDDDFPSCLEGLTFSLPRGAALPVDDS